MPFCSNCGSPISESSRFCSKCGTPVLQENPSTEATPSQPTSLEQAVYAPEPEQAVYTPEPIAQESSAKNQITLQYRESTPCPKCNGAGIKVFDNGNSENCEVCAGVGNIKTFNCPDCNSTGTGFNQEPCMSCNGTGILSNEKIAEDVLNKRSVAQDLNIRGAYACPKCKGTGEKKKEECETCKGNGTIYMVDCVDCNGTGVKPDGQNCGSCNGTKLITHVEAHSIIEAHGECESFKKNPALSLLFPIISIIVTAIAAHFTFNCLLVDFGMATTWRVYVPGLILLASIYYAFNYCKSLFKGSRNDFNRDTIRFVGVAIVAASLITAIVAGPVTAGYGWLESEAKEIINKNLVGSFLTCTDVKLEKKDGSYFYGTAHFPGGVSEPIMVIYNSKHHGRSVSYEIEVRSLLN